VSWRTDMHPSVPAAGAGPTETRLTASLTEKNALIMSRLKKSNSLVIDLAEKRIAGLESIDPALSLSTELTLALYKTALTTARDVQPRTAAQRGTRRTEAAKADPNRSRALADRSRRMLSGVEAKYGPDSDEYEKAGGTRRSEHRKRRDDGEDDASPSGTPKAS